MCNLIYLPLLSTYPCSLESIPFVTVLGPDPLGSVCAALWQEKSSIIFDFRQGAFFLLKDPLSTPPFIPFRPPVPPSQWTIYLFFSTPPQFSLWRLIEWGKWIELLSSSPGDRG